MPPPPPFHHSGLGSRYKSTLGLTLKALWVLTLMYGGLDHLVLPPPTGPALTLDNEVSSGRGGIGRGRMASNRLGGSRLGRGRHVPRTRVGGRLGLLYGRRPRQPLGRDL